MSYSFILTSLYLKLLSCVAADEDVDDDDDDDDDVFIWLFNVLQNLTIRARFFKTWLDLTHWLS